MTTRYLASSQAIALGAAAALLAASPAMAQEEAAQAPLGMRCVDFLSLPDNLPLAEKFKRNGFKFQDRAGGFQPFVNVFTDLIGQQVHGMQFDERGLRLAPPGASLSVHFTIGGFVSTQPLSIRALDASGGVQDTMVLPGDGIMHTLVLTAATAPISEVRILGGGFEGVLNQACAVR
jgi:hypothetical protein